MAVVPSGWEKEDCSARAGKEKSLPRLRSHPAAEGAHRCPGRNRARARSRSRRKCERLRHLEKPIHTLIALDSGADLKYQPFRISLPREVRVRPMIMLGPRVRPSHSCWPGVLRWRYWTRSNRLLERSFWRRCWTRVSPPVQARGPGGRPEWFAHRTTSPGRHLGDKDGRADLRHPPGPKSPLSLNRIDAMHRAIITGQPIEDWRFETVLASYQGLLKRGGDRADLEEATGTRLARVTQHEQTARSARAIESILARSHRRDREVDRRARAAGPASAEPGPGLTTRLDSSNRRHARSMVTRFSP